MKTSKLLFLRRALFMDDLRNAQIPKTGFFSINSSPSHWSLNKASLLSQEKRHCSALCVNQVSILLSFPSSLKNLACLIVKVAVAVFALTLGQISSVHAKAWSKLQDRCLVASNAKRTVAELALHAYKVVAFLTLSPFICVLVGNFTPKLCLRAHNFLRLTPGSKPVVEKKPEAPNPNSLDPADPKPLNPEKVSKQNPLQVSSKPTEPPSKIDVKPEPILVKEAPKLEQHEERNGKIESQLNQTNPAKINEKDAIIEDAKKNGIEQVKTVDSAAKKIEKTVKEDDKNKILNRKEPPKNAEVHNDIPKQENEVKLSLETQKENLISHRFSPIKATETENAPLPPPIENAPRSDTEKKNSLRKTERREGNNNNLLEVIKSNSWRLKKTEQPVKQEKKDEPMDIIGSLKFNKMVEWAREQKKSASLRNRQSVNMINDTEWEENAPGQDLNPVAKTPVQNQAPIQTPKSENISNQTPIQTPKSEPKLNSSKLSESNLEENKEKKTEELLLVEENIRKRKKRIQGTFYGDEITKIRTPIPAEFLVSPKETTTESQAEMTTNDNIPDQIEISDKANNDTPAEQVGDKPLTAGQKRAKNRKKKK